MWLPLNVPMRLHTRERVRIKPMERISERIIVLLGEDLILRTDFEFSFRRRDVEANPMRTCFLEPLKGCLRFPRSAGIGDAFLGTFRAVLGIGIFPKAVGGSSSYRTRRALSLMLKPVS